MKFYIKDINYETATISNNNHVKLNRYIRSSTSTLNSSRYYYVRKGDFSIKWRNVLLLATLKVLWMYAHYLTASRRLWSLFMYCISLKILGGLGITAGAHRLWSHRSYEAKLPLRVFLAVCQCFSGQNSIFDWVRDHRVHHKWSDTDADPHNVQRGFFFSHIGWLLHAKHPELLVRARTLDFSDLLADPIVVIQHKYFIYIHVACTYIIPVAIPIYLLNESLLNCFILVMGGHIIGYHGTFFVNSAAHMFGDKPYNANIRPAENIWVAFGALGEGFHNYHHSFPSDYATSEFGHAFNPSKTFIDLMALCGQAFNLKRAKRDHVSHRKDKEHKVFDHHENQQVEEIQDGVQPYQPIGL